MKNCRIALLGMMAGIGVIAIPFMGTVHAAAKPTAVVKSFDERPNYGGYYGRDHFERYGHDRRDQWGHYDRRDQWGRYDYGDYRGSFDRRIRWEHYMHRREGMIRRMEMYHIWLRNHPYYAATPMEAVVGAAKQFGFNAQHDQFHLVRQTPSQALVEVIQSGSNDNSSVMLQPGPNGSWTVTSVTPKS
jgi:hypothetical protein